MTNAASSYAATLQSLNTDLVKHIDALRRDLRSVTSSISHAEQRKAQVSHQIHELQSELADIDSTLDALTQVKHRLEASLTEADRTFQSIVESSKRLLEQVQQDAQAVRQVATASRTGHAKP